LQNENTILSKKSLHEVKELKNSIASEKTLNAQLLEKIESLEKDVKVLREKVKYIHITSHIYILDQCLDFKGTLELSRYTAGSICQARKNHTGRSVTP
jgi:hypothetical protein